MKPSVKARLLLCVIFLTIDIKWYYALNVMKRWLKILPIICLLIAQVIVAAHIHATDDVVLEHGCIFCQTAVELASADTPEILTLNEPIYHKTNEAVSFIQNIVYFNLINHYDTRAPPKA